MAANIQSEYSPQEIELVSRVHGHFPNNEPTRFVYFYTIASPYSNFYPCIVIENDIQFNCTEQYMMYHKAST